MKPAGDEMASAAWRWGKMQRYWVLDRKCCSLGVGEGVGGCLVCQGEAELNSISKEMKPATPAIMRDPVL